jgi:hypothetical protein
MAARFSPGYFNQTRFAALRHAVTNRILHQRLENELRNQRVANRRIDRPAHLQSVGKTHLLNRQVFFDELQLLLERDLLSLTATQHLPQDAAEQFQHSRCVLRLLVPDEHGDRVQAVEQEVWIQLGAKRCEPRFGKLCRQLRLLRFPFARLAVVGKSVNAAQHGEIKNSLHGLATS